jgi:hypothetical protein
MMLLVVPTDLGDYYSYRHHYDDWEDDSCHMGDPEILYHDYHGQHQCRLLGILSSIGKVVIRI